MTGTDYQCISTNGISAIDAEQWQSLADQAGPFLQYEFLYGLEKSACVGLQTGWQPRYITVYLNNRLVGAIPGYLKSDSYGEYVFDHSWANAYHQYGLAYYPKWIAAIPFTPVSGPRILVHPQADRQAVVATLLKKVNQQAEAGISSSHMLFSLLDDAGFPDLPDYLARYTVQFQWHNYGYREFSDFTTALTSRKRKEIRKSRQQLTDRGIQVNRLTGQQISPADMDFFYYCYQQTYLKRSGHSGYLNQAFFSHLLAHMTDRLMLVIASRDEAPVASALFFYDQTGLFGRYWGSLEDIPGLHFECCYFQGIEFAIQHALPLFNPGTQGEHKILRGFEPVYCVSLHRLYAPAFHQAVADFLHRETPAIVEYFHQARDVLPFNQAFRETLISTHTPDIQTFTTTTRSTL